MSAALRNETERARHAFGSTAPSAIARLRREEHRCVECGYPLEEYTRGCAACAARSRYRRGSLRAVLRRHLTTRRDAARAAGWEEGADAFDELLRELERRPHGKLHGIFRTYAEALGLLGLARRPR